MSQLGNLSTLAQNRPINYQIKNVNSDNTYYYVFGAVIIVILLIIVINLFSGGKKREYLDDKYRATPV